MTTFTIYANIDLADVAHESATYSQVRNGTSSTVTVRNTLTSAVVYHTLSGSTYKASQAFMSFDTRALPAYPPSLPVELSVVLNVPGGMGAMLFEATEIEDYDGVAGDFIPGASLSSSPVYGETAGLEFPNASNTKTTFSGPSTIDRVARYCVAFWAKDQRLNVAPSSSSAYGFIFGSANVIEARHPYLTITYLPEATLAGALDAVTASAGATISPVTATASPAIAAVVVAAEGVNGVRIAGSPALDPVTAAITATAKVPVSQVADRTITFPADALADRTLRLED